MRFPHRGRLTCPHWRGYTRHITPQGRDRNPCLQSTRRQRHDHEAGHGRKENVQPRTKYTSTSHPQKY
jgi:hypothetical protein